FAVNTSTVYRWQHQLTESGAGGLAAERTGPRGPSKLSQPVVDKILSLRGRGCTMAQIAARVGVATSSVGRVLTPSTRDNTEADKAAGTSQNSVGTHISGHGDTVVTDNGADDHDSQDGLPLLAEPADRAGERALARFGLLDEAPPVFTPAARVPLAGMLLAVPALVAGGLLDSARDTYGRLPNGFYGLDTTLMEAVFRTL